MYNTKTTILLLLFLTASLNICFAQPLRSKVDERFELTSIAFRLADAREYVTNDLEDYVNRIDTYFSKHKNHPLITYINNTLREQNYIGFDAVASSTTLLEIVNGKVRLSPQADIDKYLESDHRWTKEAILKYVDLLNCFYRSTKFNKFYNQNKELYIKAEQQMDTLLATINTDWFEPFYGKPFGNPYVYIGMCNGPHNYAFSPFIKDNPSGYGIVVGCIGSDEKNIPVFNKYLISPVIVHEFAHNFTNPLIQKYMDVLKNAGDKVYPHVEKQLRQVGYGSSETMIIEGFNNLFTYMYFKENPLGNEPYIISNAENNGFIWTKRAVSFMNNFYSDRNLYPTIEEFFPQLVKFMEFTANNINVVKKEYEDEIPYVVNVYPAQNSTVDAYSIDTIKIEFSHPMGVNICIRDVEGEILVNPTDFSKDNLWSKDLKSISIPVSLKEHASYGFRILEWQSQSRFAMKDEFEVRFKTK